VLKASRLFAQSPCWNHRCPPVTKFQWNRIFRLKREIKSSKPRDIVASQQRAYWKIPRPIRGHSPPPPTCFFWALQWTFGFYKIRVISWLAEWLLASQGLCSRDLVSKLEIQYSKGVVHSAYRLCYGLDDRGSIPGRGYDEIFSLRHRVQDTYPMRTGSFYPGDKAAGAWSWPLTSILCQA
jgi:hypothetical protein